MRAPHSVRKWKDIMRFEIRYFFLEVGLSPKGLTQTQEKSISFQTSLYAFAVHGLTCFNYSGIVLIPEDIGVELLKFGHKLSHWPKERL